MQTLQQRGGGDQQHQQPQKMSSLAYILRFPLSSSAILILSPLRDVATKNNNLHHQHHHPRGTNKHKESSPASSPRRRSKSLASLREESPPPAPSSPSPPPRIQRRRSSHVTDYDAKVVGRGRDEDDPRDQSQTKDTSSKRGKANLTGNELKDLELTSAVFGQQLVEEALDKNPKVKESACKNIKADVLEYNAESSGFKPGKFFRATANLLVRLFKEKVSYSTLCSMHSM